MSAEAFRNIQGDIIYGLVKKYQVFSFFQIRKPAAFKQAFARHVYPLITTTEQVVQEKEKARAHKRRHAPGLLPIRGLNVAFSSSGLAKLGIDPKIDFDENDKSKPGPFTQGQFANAQVLGDPGHFTSGNFDPAWRDEFKRPVHGVFLITGESYEIVEKHADEVGRFFSIADGINASIVEVLRFRGQARPEETKQNGHEHFGYLDGVSQPAVIGFHPIPNPASKIPKAVDPGVILFGEKGDIHETCRPKWTKQGSILVFRQLAQLVPEFDKFLEDHQKDPKQVIDPGLTPEENKQLLGARMVGRWKSGTPVVLAPKRDSADPALHTSNDFDFEVPAGQPPQSLCPFFGHIRKTMPRTDLSVPFGQNAINRSRIMRHGIPYGPEVSDSELATRKTENDRGLAFVSYQSDLIPGFQFMQQSWANNADFPPKGDHRTGLDPIIGQANADPSIVNIDPATDDREAFGLIPGRETSKLKMPIEFVVAKGGEYFFSPPMKALRSELFSDPPVAAPSLVDQTRQSR